MQNPVNEQPQEWLLFFYSIPATPVNSRVKIWRKLIKAGAVQLKGGVYILPENEEHREALQWLLAELPTLQGEGLLVRTASIEPLSHQEIIDLFNYQRNQQYQDITDKIGNLRCRTESARKGGKDKKHNTLIKQYEKIQTDFRSVQRLDFFQSNRGLEMAKEISAIREQIDELAAVEKKQSSRQGSNYLAENKRADFTGKIWVTRRRPFVDRMACAWLIRRFIDPNATFSFREEPEIAGINSTQEISFDVQGGVFTHLDDLCTFEVLLRSFAIEDRAAHCIARIVHDIDMKDDKFQAPEGHGLEMILKGFRQQALSDIETLEQGISVFAALYTSLAEKHNLPGAHNAIN